MNVYLNFMIDELFRSYGALYTFVW